MVLPGVAPLLWKFLGVFGIFALNHLVKLAKRYLYLAPRLLAYENRQGWANLSAIPANATMAFIHGTTVHFANGSTTYFGNGTTGLVLVERPPCRLLAFLWENLASVVILVALVAVALVVIALIAAFLYWLCIGHRRRNGNGNGGEVWMWIFGLVALLALVSPGYAACVCDSSNRVECRGKDLDLFRGSCRPEVLSLAVDHIDCRWLKKREFRRVEKILTDSDAICPMIRGCSHEFDIFCADGSRCCHLGSRNGDDGLAIGLSTALVFIFAMAGSCFGFRHFRRRRAQRDLEKRKNELESGRNERAGPRDEEFADAQSEIVRGLGDQLVTKPESTELPNLMDAFNNAASSSSSAPPVSFLVKKGEVDKEKGVYFESSGGSGFIPFPPPSEMGAWETRLGQGKVICLRGVFDG